MTLALQSERIRIPLQHTEMAAALWLPDDPLGVVVFADEHAGARLKPPNDYLSEALRSARLGTLWLDLIDPAMTPAPAAAIPAGAGPATPDLPALSARLDAACAWLESHPVAAGLPVGLFGSGRTGAAALELAARRPRCICAVVARGACAGQLGPGTLGRIAAPTLLIVGGLDDAVITANRGAYAALHCKKRLEIIPGATRSFEEPGSPEVVARLARNWFLQHGHFTAA